MIFLVNIIYYKLFKILIEIYFWLTPLLNQKLYLIITDDSDADPLYSPELNNAQGNIYVMFIYF